MSNIKKSLMSIQPNIITFNDSELFDNLNNLMENNQEFLHANEYSFSNIYQNMDTGIKYALIYAFYLESDFELNGMTIEDIDNAILEDGKMMHKQLKNSNLNCDYLYIMPYYDFIDRTKGDLFFNNKILTTDIFNINL